MHNYAQAGVGVFLLKLCKISHFFHFAQLCPSWCNCSNGQIALSIPLHFPPTRSLDNSQDGEMTILNPSIPFSFLRVSPPPNAQTAFYIPSHLPPTRSPNGSLDCEMTNPNPSILSLFPQVFPPLNVQTTHSIPLHFPPTIFYTSSKCNQTLKWKNKSFQPITLSSLQVWDKW